MNNDKIPYWLYLTHFKYYNGVLGGLRNTSTVLDVFMATTYTTAIYGELWEFVQKYGWRDYYDDIRI